MPRVRVPVAGTAGKTALVNSDATYGAQLGVDLFDEDGGILSLADLAERIALSLVDGDNDVVFESQIVDDTILARVADNETITGQWTFENRVDIDNGQVLRIHDTTDADYVEFGHDGIDFNITGVGTTDINLTGITTLQAGTVAAVFASFAGDGALVTNVDAVTLDGIDSLQFLRSDVADTKTAGILRFDDNVALTFGTGDDINVSWSGSQLNVVAPLADSLVAIRDGIEFRFFDSTDTDFGSFTHDGADFNLQMSGTTNFDIRGGTRVLVNDMDVRIDARGSGGSEFFEVMYDDVAERVFMRVTRETGVAAVLDMNATAAGNIKFIDKQNADTIWMQFVTNSDVRIRDGYALRIYDSTDTDYFQVQHNGVDVDFTFANTTDLNIHGVVTRFLNGSGVRIQDGQSLRIFDSTDADYIDLAHNGTDATITVVGAGDFDFIGADYYVFDDDIRASNGGVSAAGSVSNTGINEQVAFMDVNGGVGRFGSYNWSLTAWQPVQVQGSTLSLSTTATDEPVIANRFAVENVDARIYIKDTDAAVDEKDWLFQSTGGTLRFYAANDARNSFDEFFRADRTGNVVDLLTFAASDYVFYSGEADASLAIGRNANERFLFTVLDGTGTITLDQDELDATAHQFIFNIESGNTGSRGFQFSDNGTLKFHIDHLNDRVTINDGYVLRVQDGTDADYAQFQHDGTDFNVSHVGTTDVNFTGITGTYIFDSAMTMVDNVNGGLTFQIDNDSTGVSAFARTSISSGDGNVAFYVTGTAYTGTIVTNGPTGAQSVLRTLGSYPIVFGTANTDRMRVGSAGGIFIREIAAAEGDIAGLGQIWVRNDTPNTLMFTDDAGNDHDLTAGGGGDWGADGTMDDGVDISWANASQPWLTLDSTSSGDNWTAQGAGISVGESGKKGSAAIHMTYNGDGSGYVGMGSVNNTAGTGGRPSFSHIDFTYNSHVLGLRSQVQIIGTSPYLRVYDPGATDYFLVTHDGTDVVFNGGNTTDLRFETGIRAVVLEDQPIDHWFVEEGADTIRSIMYPAGGYLSIDASGQTGAFRIEVPNSVATGGMSHLVIRGYDYLDGNAAWAVILGGYEYATNDVWLNNNATIIGNPPFDVIKFQSDASDQLYIQLGLTTDTHQYPKVWIESYNTGFSGQSTHTSDGWSISLVTNETGITTDDTINCLRFRSGHNSTTAEFRSNSLNAVEFEDGLDVYMRDGGEFRVYDGGDDDYFSIDHSGSLLRLNTVGTGVGAVDFQFQASGTELLTVRHSVTTGETSYARLRDHDGNYRDVGFNDSLETRTNTSFTMDAGDAGGVAHYTDGSNYNATLAANTNLDFPVGARMDIINRGAGTVNINQGTGTTLYWPDGGGASFTTGSRDLVYGWCTIWRQSSTIYYITGNGIT